MTKPSHWEMTSGHSEMTIYKKSDADDSKSVTTDFGQTRMTIFKKSFATDRHFSLCAIEEMDRCAVSADGIELAME